jgi:hypothetical protein
MVRMRAVIFFDRNPLVPVYLGKFSHDNGARYCQYGRSQLDFADGQELGELMRAMNTLPNKKSSRCRVSFWRRDGFQIARTIP